MAYSGAFARLYDSFNSPAEYSERAKYIISEIRKGGVDSGIMLDLGCGSGEMTGRLAQSGFEIIAVDNSFDMLCLAREKLLPSYPGMLFLCQDMRELDLYGTVDCAVCSLDGLNHLLTTSDLKQAFDSVALFMRPGGVFVFDVNTVYKHRDVLSGQTFVFEDDENMLIWRNSECGEDDTVDIGIDIFTLTEDGSYDRYSEDFSERAYSEDTLKKLLASSGFDVINICGDPTEENEGGQFEKIYFTAVKRPCGD